MAKRPTKKSTWVDPRVGRPAIYTKKLADEICTRIADGELLEDICKDDHLPCRVTVYNWTHTNQEFMNDYALARQVQMHVFADKTVKRAYDESRDVIVAEEITGLDAKGNEVKKVVKKSDNTAVQRDNLIFKVNAFLMGRLNAAAYGDKITQEVTGKDGAPLTPVINIKIDK